MKKYTTLNKQKVELSFTIEQKDLLKIVYDLFKDGSYPDMVSFVYSQEILEQLGAKYEFGGYWVDQQVSQKPLYKLVEDLETRLAIQAGRLSESPNTNTDFSKNRKVLEEYLNS